MHACVCVHVHVHVCVHVLCYLYVYLLPHPQGVYARGVKGNASSSQAAMFKAIVPHIAERGRAFIK